MTAHAYEPVDTHQPPNDIAAEQATLGGILKLATESTNKAHERLAEVLDIAPPEVFYRSAHQVILTAMTALSDRGEPLDAIAVNKELLARGETSTTGGSVYLHTLVDATPSPASTTYHAKIVADCAILRRLVEVGTRIAQIGYTGEGDVADLVEIARRGRQHHCPGLRQRPPHLDPGRGLPNIPGRDGVRAGRRGGHPVPLRRPAKKDRRHDPRPAHHRGRWPRPGKNHVGVGPGPSRCTKRQQGPVPCPGDDPQRGAGGHPGSRAAHPTGKAGVRQGAGPARRCRKTAVSEARTGGCGSGHHCR